MDEKRALQLALGYWPARAFTAAGELGVYELLARDGPLDAATVAWRLGVRSRAMPQLLDALVALEVLSRVGETYSLAGELPDGEILAMGDRASLHAWAELPVVLREGRRQGPSMYEELSGDPERLEGFADLMARTSSPAHEAVVGLDLSDVATVCDAGGADGRLAVSLASHHPHLRCTSFDLPAYAPLVGRRAEAAGVADRVSAIAGDFFVDPLPSSDVVVLSLVLLDWDEDEKRRLLSACRDALPPGGRLVIVERFAEDESETAPRAAFDLLRSLHFLVLLGDAHRFRARELDGWLAETGFDIEATQPLANGFSLVIARRTTE